MSRRARALRALEPVALLAVPTVAGLCAYLQLSATGGLVLLVTLFCLALFFASYEVSRPALRQILPTATLGAVAAAGRIVFAPLPDVKPVSAIAIVAGATLGRRSGFLVGAIAALVSNLFFGQGAWTPMQMYAWGLVGYLAGVLADVGAFRRGWVLYAYGAAGTAAGRDALCRHGRLSCGHLAAVAPGHQARRRKVRPALAASAHARRMRGTLRRGC